MTRPDTRDDILSLAAQILALLELHGDDFHICERCGHQEDAAFKNTDLFGFIKDAAEVHLAAAPRPPAAEAPGQEPVAVLWQVHDFADGWITYSSEVGALSSVEALNGNTVRPLFAAPPTYADAEAKADELQVLFDKVKLWPENRMKPDAVLELGEGFTQLLDLRNAVPGVIAAIRSLASPAPKGET
jgi:hypothetical protein